MSWTAWYSFRSENIFQRISSNDDMVVMSGTFRPPKKKNDMQNLFIYPWKYWPIRDNEKKYNWYTDKTIHIYYLFIIYGTFY